MHAIYWPDQDARTGRAPYTSGCTDGDASRRIARGGDEECSLAVAASPPTGYLVLLIAYPQLYDRKAGLEMSSRKTFFAHYFTGTGNTARVVELLQAQLRLADWQGQTRPVTFQPPQFPQSDLHLFAFPVHAFAIPQVMRLYMKALPKGDGATAAVLAVVGDVSSRRPVAGYEGQALTEARRLLLRRGYDVVLSDVVTHVNNFTQAVSPPPPKEWPLIDELAQGQVRSIAQRLLNGTVSHRHCPWYNKAWSIIIGGAFRTLGRPGMGKLFAADPNCNSCGLCANKCPVGAINMVEGKPRWRLNCQACQRCINICPKTSIQTSVARVAVFAALLAVPYWQALYFLAPDSMHALPQSLALAAGALSYFVGYVALCLAMDWLIFRFEKVRLLNRVLSWGLTRFFRRYVEPNLLSATATESQTTSSGPLDAR